MDRVEVVPPLPGVREGEAEPGEEEDFRRRMRAEELDLALQWHGGAGITEGAPLARARHRPLCSYRMDCPECGTHVERDFCPHEVSFVADVDPERVAAVALELTGRGTPDPAALAHGLDPRAHW